MKIALLIVALSAPIAAAQSIIAKIPSLVPSPPERVIALTKAELSAIGQYHLLRSHWELRAKLDAGYSDRATELLLVNAEAAMQERKAICVSDYDAIRSRLGGDAAIAILRYGTRRCSTEETYLSKDAIRSMLGSNTTPDYMDGVSGTDAALALRIGRIAVVGANLIPEVSDSPKPASWRPVDELNPAAAAPAEPVIRKWTKRAGGEIATGELVKETANGFAVIEQASGEWIAVKTSTLCVEDRDFIAAAE